LRKLFDEFGPIPSRERVKNYQATTGIDGKVGAFKWDLTYSHGKTVFDLYQPNQFEQTKLAAALDAVVDPASGRIVCRPTLSTDATVRANYAGCVPLNPFGYGAASTAARDYVMGVSTYRASTVTDDAVIGLSGDLFRLPAGAVSVALGAEYRKQSLNLTSNSNPAVNQDLTGLRGLAANATRFYLTNTGVASGSNTVKEVFGEVAVPVLKDIPGIESFDLNGAIRYTDYSTSGGVTTWKIGGIWKPIDGLTFRATKSRDIRAPTLFDLFAGSQFIQTALLDPLTNTSGSFFQRQSGNPNLQPEIGNTLSLGSVFQPRFLPGFSLSVDYYKIKITGAIATLGAPQLLLDCFQSNGTAPSCASISRPISSTNTTAANFPTQVLVAGVNIATLETRGIDIDASYRTRLGNGSLDLRVYANYVDSYRTQQSNNQPSIQYAGYSTLGGRADTTIPKFKASVSANYDSDSFGLFVQENMTGKIKLGPTLIYAQPGLREFFTTDATLTLHPKIARGTWDFFLTVNNVFDATPPQFFVNTVPGLGVGTLINLYDSTGRQFTAGVRFRF
jgi:outer membrane receptor protein involved in Fe transport